MVWDNWLQQLVQLSMFSKYIRYAALQTGVSTSLVLTEGKLVWYISSPQTSGKSELQETGRLRISHHTFPHFQCSI